MMLINLWLKFIKWSLIVTPLVLVAVLVSLPIIDAVFPWSVAESALDEQGRGGLAICVGMSSSSSGRNDERSTTNQRSYLLVTKGEVATVSETHANGSRNVSLDTNRWGVWIILLILLSLVWLSLWLSLPRIASAFKKRRNGSLPARSGGNGLP